MAVTGTIPIVEYIGNDITTQFPFNFKVLEANDLQVFLDDALQTSGIHYTLDNNFTTVTFVTAPPNLSDVRIVRNTEMARSTDYIEGGGLSSDTLDNDFDRLTMTIQEMNINGGTGTNGGGTISTDAGGNRIINVADPIDLQDAVTKNYVDSQVPEAQKFESDTYNIDTNQGWKLDPDTGAAIFHDITVRDNNGQVVFSAGGLDWGNVINKPANLVETYYQSVAPASAVSGDYWIDTDDNKTYRWNGSTWLLVQDQDIVQALLDAGTAQATADGKVVTFAQDEPPTADGVGDIWIDTNDGNSVHRWDGTTWVDYRDTTIATAQAQATLAVSDAADAQSTADGKIVTFFQTSTPTGQASGDLWVDTDDSNKLYRWNGSSWITIQDGQISQAISNAATAQSTADGKIVTYYQNDAPVTGLTIGDLWVDTNDTNKLYRHNGTSWISVQDGDIALGIANAATAQTNALQAISDASNAQAIADGKIVTFFQDNTPTGQTIGDLWVDTNDNNKMYRYNGTSWITIQDGKISTAITNAATAQATADGKIVSYYAATAPTGQTVGDYWTDSDDNQLYRWSGSSWVSIRDSSIQTAISDASNAAAIADSKILSFYQTSAPSSGMTVGDLWIDTDDKNKLYRYNSSSWISVRDATIVEAEGATWGDNITGQPTDTQLLNTNTTPADIGYTGDLNADATNYLDTRVANAIIENSVLTIARPIGATYSGSSSVTGAIKITLPQSWTNTMMRFTVDVFELTTGLSFSLLIGGYNYNAISGWHSTTANLFGNAAADNRVRFGHDGVKCCIYIGEITSNWSHVKVSVRDFQAGYSYSQIEDWDDGWSISVDSTVGTITADYSDALIDAASIKNQGALATKSSVDLASEVTNKSLANVDGAANTKLLGIATGADATNYSDTRVANTVLTPTITQAQTDASTAIQDASDAQATADGKVVTFVQTSAPTAEGIGDIWLDSNDGNKLYRWSGSAWVAYAQDTADWTKVYGTGRPENYSTAGATIGGTLSGQFSAADVSTYFQAAAIGYAQIGSVNLTGTNFKINEGQTGARISMDGNVIKVYDDTGTLRVQLGNLAL